MDLKYLTQEMQLNPLCQVLKPNASAIQIPSQSSIGSKSTRLMVQPDPLLLSTAIDNVSSERLRTTFKFLCQKSPEATRLAGAALLVSSDEVLLESSSSLTGSDGSIVSDSENEREDGDSPKSEEESASSISDPLVEKNVVPLAGTKRKAPNNSDPESLRYRMCQNCEGEFDVTENVEGCCIWHSGSKELDERSDFWADWEDGYGEREDQADEFPEGFLWSCCDQQGDAEGCNKTRHLSGYLKKRARN